MNTQSKIHLRTNKGQASPSLSPSSNALSLVAVNSMGLLMVMRPDAASVGIWHRFDLEGLRSGMAKTVGAQLEAVTLSCLSNAALIYPSLKELCVKPVSLMTVRA